MHWLKDPLVTVIYSVITFVLSAALLALITFSFLNIYTAL